MFDLIPSDQEVRAVYATLIGESWKRADTYHVYQEAWNILAKHWNIEDITDNGFGRVIRNNGRTSS